MADQADVVVERKPASVAYLDIETSFRGTITVIGLYRPSQTTVQLVGDQVKVASILDALDGVETLKTYNGSRFDLPVIHQRLGIDLKSLFNHDDLMYTCWKQGFKGGLKSVERQLGIVRETAEVDGMQAMYLWAQWEERQDSSALQTLLHYNREDVELLAEVEARLEQHGR